MSDLLRNKAFEAALKHAQIIEEECKKVIDKFKCNPKDLIIEYQNHTNIRINVKGSHFELTSGFRYEDEEFKYIVGVDKNET